MVAGFLGLQLLAPGWMLDPLDWPNLYEVYETAPGAGREFMDTGFTGSGTMLFFAFLAAAPVAFLMAAALARRYHVSAKSFLGLRWPTVRQALAWTAALLVLRYGITALLDRAGIEVGGESLIDGYRASWSLPLLYLGAVVLGPAFEAVLFRGFLLEGLRRSRLGVLGAVMLTAGLWAICHSYEAAGLAVIFCDGLLLAAARLHTRSTYLTIGMHALVNLLVLIQIGSFQSHDGTRYYLERGREHFEGKQYWEAALDFQAAERYAKRPCAECRLGLARAYQADGEPRRAEEAMRGHR